MLKEGFAPGDVFTGFFAPVLPMPPAYHPDGQVKEEDYVYGSFVQSRMYQSGVTCSHCHDPHGGQLKASGNAVCTQCHVPQVYDTPNTIITARPITARLVKSFSGHPLPLCLLTLKVERSPARTRQQPRCRNQPQGQVPGRGRRQGRRAWTVI